MKHEEKFENLMKIDIGIMMVGEDAHPGFGVAETLVECGEYRGERDGVAAVSEDGPQSLNLFLGVA